MDTRKSSSLKFPAFVLLGLTFLFVLSNGCGDDNGVSSEFATVKGTIAFENAVMWPDSGLVLVTIWPVGIWTEFGPIGPPAGVDTLQKVAGQDKYAYEFEGVSPGTYSAIAVGWEHPDENRPRETRVATLGVYWGNPDSVSVGLNIPQSPFVGPPPAEFTVDKGDVVTFDFKADFIWVQFL